MSEQLQTPHVPTEPTFPERVDTGAEVVTAANADSSVIGAGEVLAAIMLIALVALFVVASRRRSKDSRSNDG